MKQTHIAGLSNSYKELSVALLCTLFFGNTANSAQSSPPIATAADVFGDQRTQRIEHQIEVLQGQYPRTTHMISDADEDKSYRKLTELVNQVRGLEQLIRLAYWGQSAHPSPYDSPVEIVHGTFFQALTRIKELYPAKATDAILEVAMLLRADAHTGEMIDELLSSEKPPDKSPPGVYVYVDRARDATTPALLALHFNITRQFWLEWKSSWSGKCLFKVDTEFELDGKGSARQVCVTASPLPGCPPEKSTLIKESTQRVRQIIQLNHAYLPANKDTPRIKVHAVFYG